MIHLLTQDPAAKKQLAELLKELEHEHVFHESLEPLLKAIRKLNKSDAVFYDMQLEELIWAFEPLYTGCKRTNLVTFERLTEQTSIESSQCPAGVENYLLLPSNKDRALARVQSILREIAQKAAKKKKARKKVARKVTRKTETTPKAAPQAATPPSNALPIFRSPTIARYLQAHSMVMQNFLVELDTKLDQRPIILLEGDEGAEFELVARELNFRASGDSSPLYALDPMHLDTEILEKILKEGQAGDHKVYCYLGLTEDWSSNSAIELASFLDKLFEIKDAPLQLIVGHVNDSEAYFPSGVKPVFKAVRKQSTPLAMPTMESREDDIAMIVHNIFSTLRMAHPFLRTRTISSSAIKYLQANCATFDYAKLCRVIRNAMALSQRDRISKEEVRNLSDDSATSQHLIESLADERYFKYTENS